jgi:hypothetical protein
LIVIEDSEGEVLHVECDAIAQHDHQDDAAQDGEAQAEGVAAQFQRLAQGVAEQAAEGKRTGSMEWWSDEVTRG